MDEKKYVSGENLVQYNEGIQTWFQQKIDEIEGMGISYDAENRVLEFAEIGSSGGSGSTGVEMCTVSIENSPVECIDYYMGETGYQTKAISTYTTDHIPVMKNSILHVNEAYYFSQYVDYSDSVNNIVIIDNNTVVILDDSRFYMKSNEPDEPN